VENTAPPGGQPSADLFAQGGQFKTGTPARTGSRYDVSQQQPPDLFQPMGGVRYI